MSVKRTMLWAAWGLVPLAALVVHAGPGQALWSRDTAASALKEAKAAEAQEEWKEAAAKYAQARQLLPSGEGRLVAELSLAEARATAWSGDLLAAGVQLETLLGQQTSEKDEPSSPEFVKRVRAELASTAYATAWGMRVEGAPRQEWGPESEVARQQYRLLAESAVESKDEVAQLMKENLEAVEAILQQLDVPSQAGETTMRIPLRFATAADLARLRIFMARRSIRRCAH